MSDRFRIGGRLGRAGRPAMAATLALLLGLGTFAASALPARAAAAVAFGSPVASGTLGEPLAFSQPFTVTGPPPDAVEFLWRTPGAEATQVATAVATGGGPGYRAAITLDQHVLPNTQLLYRFRVIEGDQVTLGPEASWTVLDERFTWRTRMGRYVRLHWYQGNDAFAARAVAIGDEAIASVSALLGVTETEPIDFFVYASQAGLDGALGPGVNEFVAGVAEPAIRTLFAEIDPQQAGSDWVDSVIPHELTHLVFDTATHNPYRDPPHWLNEGLAVYEAQGYAADDRGRIRDAIAAGRVLPLTGLVGGFPQSETLFYQSYAEAVSAVDFFARRYGQAALARLVRSYAAGVTDDEAFSAATGAPFEAFQQAWLAEIGAPAPRTYGPQPAPTAPGSGGPTTAPAGRPTAPSASPSAGVPVVLPAGLGLLVALGLLLVVRRRRAAAHGPAVPSGWAGGGPWAGSGSAPGDGRDASAEGHDGPPERDDHAGWDAPA